MQTGHKSLISNKDGAAAERTGQPHLAFSSGLEGNEIALIDILGSEADDVADLVQLKIEKPKIYRNLDILVMLIITQ
jgi:hypothetical protein